MLPFDRFLHMNSKCPAAHAILTFAVLLSPLTAQTPSRPSATETGETKVMEAFTVTGSSIRRVDEERTLPVTVIELEDFELRAAPAAAELLSMLPNGGVLSLTETNVLGA